jgi:hypothetical protein
MMKTLSVAVMVSMLAAPIAAHADQTTVDKLSDLFCDTSIFGIGITPDSLIKKVQEKFDLPSVSNIAPNMYNIDGKSGEIQHVFIAFAPSNGGKGPAGGLEVAALRSDLGALNKDELANLHSHLDVCMKNKVKKANKTTTEWLLTRDIWLRLDDDKDNTVIAAAIKGKGN